MRDAARRIIRRVGVETGGSNIQFAVNPANGRMIVIEMNPRVSRSSALASKATGFPIAKIAAKLALGYHLDEIPNDITRLTPASFEPTIDYVVVKIPRWNFEKFPQADRTLTTQMKSVGEAMAIGRTFKEAFMKGVRSLELGRSGLLFAPSKRSREGRRGRCGACSGSGWRFRPTGGCGTCSARSTAAGRVEQIHELTKIDPWFLRQFAEIAAMRQRRGGRRARRARRGRHAPPEARRLRRSGAGAGGGHQRDRGPRAARGAGPEAGLQAGRHVRRRVRVVHAVSLQLVRADLRGEPERAATRSSSSAAGPTGSGRASSSTTAAVTRPSRCAKKASRR